MTQLLKYHTTAANPRHVWENMGVAVLLQEGLITSYEEYLKACKLHKCDCYNEETFKDHLEGIEAD